MIFSFFVEDVDKWNKWWILGFWGKAPLSARVVGLGGKDDRDIEIKNPFKPWPEWVLS